MAALSSLNREVIGSIPLRHNILFLMFQQACAGSTRLLHAVAPACELRGWDPSSRSCTQVGAHCSLAVASASHACICTAPLLMRAVWRDVYLCAVSMVHLQRGRPVISANSRQQHERVVRSRKPSPLMRRSHPTTSLSHACGARCAAAQAHCCTSVASSACGTRFAVQEHERCVELAQGRSRNESTP